MADVLGGPVRDSAGRVLDGIYYWMVRHTLIVF